MVNFFGVGCFCKEMFGLEELYSGYELLFREFNMILFIFKKFCNSLILFFKMIQLCMYFMVWLNILCMFLGIMLCDLYLMVVLLMMIVLCILYRSWQICFLFLLNVDSQFLCLNVILFFWMVFRNVVMIERFWQVLIYVRVIYEKNLYIYS